MAKYIKKTQEGQPHSQKDSRILETGIETLKNNINVLNDILKVFITIACTLLGASFIFEKMIITGWLQLVVQIALLCCIVFAVMGLLPHEEKVSLDSPSDIEKFKKTVRQQKNTYLKRSAISFVIAISCLIAEPLFKLIETAL